MRRLLPVLLLLAACGGSAPAWTTSFDARPGARISVTAWRGTVRLSNSTSGKVEIAVRGEAPQPLDRLADVRHARSGDSGLVVHEAAKDADLAIEVAAPPGTWISCGCAEADVLVSGAWARLEVRTKGAITARVERADSGELESQEGAVLYVAEEGPVPPPTVGSGGLYARSIRGDVTLGLPATWNGHVDCATEGGKLDVAPHKNLQTIRDEDGKHVVGRVGPRGGDKPLPTVWGSSAHGNVSLRLEE